MRRLREILRNEYIGAIAIGFLLFQAASGVISLVLQPVVAYIQNRSRPQSVFSAPHSIFNWPQLTVSLIEVVLHLVVALLLILWLYRKPKAETASIAQSPRGVTPKEQQA
jgi:predicted Kef-type K+ transport protein